MDMIRTDGQPTIAFGNLDPLYDRDPGDETPEYLDLEHPNELFWDTEPEVEDEFDPVISLLPEPHFDTYEGGCYSQGDEMLQRLSDTFLAIRLG